MPAQSIAGKTGTTNDNSDLWFMGYTPQLLAGAWVGCDDRYIRFSDNYFGQGAHAALPIWANFMSKVARDPACNLDANANFEKPSTITSDFNVDFISAENIPIDNSLINLENNEDIKAESDYELPATTTPVTVNKAENNKPLSTKEAPTKKTATKANKEAQKPKAIFPPKKN